MALTSDDRVYGALAQTGQSMERQEIAEMLGMKDQLVRDSLRRLITTGEVVREVEDPNKYRLVDVDAVVDTMPVVRAVVPMGQWRAVVPKAPVSIFTMGA